MTTTSTLAAPAERATEAPPRMRPVLWVSLLLACLFAFAAFVALGMWQLNRLSWKTELIARVDQRVDAAPQPAPAPAEWGRLTAAAAEYRRVQLSGRFAHELETLVTASTALGSGYWVLTPLRTAEGFWVLVNRGFVPAAMRDRAARGEKPADGVQVVTGLLRVTEPAGSLLQANDSAAGRWYSRDVAAIAAARGLGAPGALAGAVAPYFVDAAASDDAPLDWPRPGLTVVHFSNNHLLYALTWFVLAAMLAGAIGYAVVVELRAQAPARNED